MNNNVKNDVTDRKERRFLFIYIIITVAFLAVCAAIYIMTDINEQTAYVDVTSIETNDSIIPDSEKIDLNQATVEDLKALNGIGEVTAGKILAYRDLYGSFLSVDELVNVDGIGENLLDKIRPYIYV